VLRVTDLNNSITVFVALSVPLYRRLQASTSTVNSQSVEKKPFEVGRHIALLLYLWCMIHEGITAKL
jgi:hypothetical protein